MVSIVCMIIVLNQLFGAFEHYPSSPSAVATGHLLINTQSNPIGTFNDPASVMLFEKTNIGIVWGEKFALKALSYRSAIIAMSLHNWNISAGASIFGDKLYSETIWGVVAGKQIKERLILGTSIMVYDLKIKQYGQDTSVGINFGWRAGLNENISWFGSLRNINAPTIGQSNELLPQVISSGLLYDPSEKLNLVIEWEQETLYESRIKFGGQFMLMPWLGVFTGHASSPGQLALGFNIDFKNIKINYAFSTHSYLDISHYMGVGITLR